MLKKWMLLILAIILLSFSQGRHGFFGIVEQLLHDFITPDRNLFLFSFIFLISEVMSGFLNILDRLWKFLLSWEGVLLIAIILLHINFKEYMNRKNKPASEDE
jgi:hypothetical protein